MQSVQMQPLRRVEASGSSDSTIPLLRERASRLVDDLDAHATNGDSSQVLLARYRAVSDRLREAAESHLADAEHAPVEFHRTVRTELLAASADHRAQASYHYRNALGAVGGVVLGSATCILNGFDAAARAAELAEVGAVPHVAPAWRMSSVALNGTSGALLAASSGTAAAWQFGKAQAARKIANELRKTATAMDAPV